MRRYTLRGIYVSMEMNDKTLYSVDAMVEKPILYKIGFHIENMAVD